MKTYGRNTHQGFIAEQCESGKSQSEAFATLEPLVLAQIEPMIFTRNPDRSMGESHRMPKPMAQQLLDLRNAIGRIYSAIERDRAGTGSTRQTRTIVETVETAETEIVESRPVASGKRRIETELEKMERRLDEISRFCQSRNETDPIDEIGMRPYEAAGRLIPRGVPADAILSAISIHWSRDARQDAGIADFDFTALSKRFMDEQNCESYWRNDRGQTEPLHEMFGYVLTLAQARQPIYLYGIKGTGKSHLARQLATYLDLPYGETPLSAGASRGDLLGRLTASSERPFIPAKFTQCYSGGGVFNFEEMDAALAEMIIVLNNALAGDYFENSMSGEALNKSENFIPVATANTLAMGANSKYIRERLDAATLDRWNPGRVEVKFDKKLAKHMLYKHSGGVKNS
jgi:hypothetical protein